MYFTKLENEGNTEQYLTTITIMNGLTRNHDRSFPDQNGLCSDRKECLTAELKANDNMICIHFRQEDVSLYFEIQIDQCTLGSDYIVVDLTYGYGKLMTT